MKKYLLLFLFTTSLTLSITCVNAQVDPDASEKTVILYENLKKIQNTPFFLFGQEFFNSFRYSSGSAHGDETYSDSYAVTGAHPSVLGSDFHYYLTKSEEERGYHTDAVKYAYQQGYAITFDWHLSGKGTSTYEYSVATKDLVDSIVTYPNGQDRAWLYEELDKVLDIINNDLVVEGENIPIVFRPWHEMNGGWFWWGSQATSSANYKAFYALTVDYMRERTNSVLFCWSPNTPTNFNYYPGDDYVDILGVDFYEINATNFRTQIAPIVDHAQANDKVAVFSETGNRTSDGNNAAGYWNDTVLPAILEDPSGKAIRIAWVLTWINSSWSYPYVPNATSSTTAKQSFINFKNSPNTLFGDEIQDMYTPWVITGSEERNTDAGFSLSPMPTNNLLTIRLGDLKSPSNIRIYDMTGKQVQHIEMRDKEYTFNITQTLTTGLYVVRATDFTKTYTQKLIIE